MNPARAFWRFFIGRFPAPRYLAYVVLWPAGILGALAPLRPPGAAVGPGLAEQVCGALAVFVILFFMRAVDEVKDLDYDREFNPERPLVTGETGVAAVRVYLAGSAVAAVALSAVVGAAAVVGAVLIMAYSLFLLLLERVSERFRESVWGNIVITIQLKTGLVCYVALLPRPGDAGTPALPTALVVLSFVLAYLHWEIARKTVRARFALPGEKLYSTARGAAWSLGAAVALMLAACALRVAVVLGPDAAEVRPAALAVLVVPLALVLRGVLGFRGHGEARRTAGGPAFAAYLAFLAAGAVQPALMGGAPAWFG
ncbi:hypothetical protein [Streptomyces sp. 35G-GA-8]|uniref:hypothetical protein n=1 Tax=Streptomyces sp. 35G-GA-8 TaxID=2939434 RepID=UPI00201E836D|nr:hypothetical protein [Streptomyces sp. 35G-GA-8]MCL7376955.1 hypothetical protein [Streptomyces sp. 35G-GA-8]